MKEQLKALWRETWWLWCLFVAGIAFISYAETPAFLLTLAILPPVYVYFAFIRFDEDGEKVSENGQ
ncbi:MAG TPA: hypothetical protein DDW52_12155 [Planctomycetaceae bacterium]|nr:hypothetical protein [Planctomycetaceae bacterium]